MSLLVAMALADEPALDAILDVRVESYRTLRPAAKRRAVDRPSVPITRSESIKMDGVLNEPAWQIAAAGPALLPLAAGREVDASWGWTALQTPVGLAVAMRGVTDAHTVFLQIDPDGTQRGWTRIEIVKGELRWSICGPPAHIPATVVPAMLRNVSWGCVQQDSSGVAMSFGDRGVEMLVPWAALGRTTEQMKVLWWLTGPDRTGGTWDMYGGQPRHTQAGRGIRVVDRTRTTSGWVVTDLDADAQSFVVSAAGMREPEAWMWQLTYQGQVLDGGQVTLTPGKDGTGKATIAVSDRPLNGTIATAWRAEAGALRPGSQGRFYNMAYWTTLSTPVFTDELVLSYQLRDPANKVPVQILDATTQAVLAEAPVSFPAGKGRVHITAKPEWPDQVVVRAGSLLLEGEATAVRDRFGGSP